MTLIGGRPVHPVNVRIGGFYRLPTRAELSALRSRCCARARKPWRRSLRRPASNSPTSAAPGLPLAAHARTAIPSKEGHWCPARACFRVAELGGRVIEEHVKGSNALHSRLRGSVATLSARSRGTRSAPTSCRRSPARPPGLPGSARRAAIRSARSSCEPSNWSTRSTKRCASSTWLGAPLQRR